MSTPDVTPKKRLPWSKIILVISLAVNLLIAGLVAGAFFGEKRDRGPAMRDLGLGPFFQALSREDRRELGAKMREQSGSFQQNRAELREKFESFLAALHAEPFDRAEIERLIAEQRAHLTDRQAMGQKLLLDRLEEMSASERVQYAADLAKTFKRGPRRDRR